MSLRIKSLDLDIPYWIFFLCIILPLLIIAPYAIGPNCHGLCTEDQATSMMTWLILAMISTLVISAVGIGIWQGVIFYLSMTGRNPGFSFPVDKIDAIMGLLASLVGVTGILLILSILFSYGFSIFGMIITAIGPIIFLIIGYFFLKHRLQRVGMRAVLQKRGMPITTNLLDVEMDTRWSENGVRPYQIISIGVHPKAGKKRFFSDHIWMNPSGYVPSKIRVVIDPENPDNYKMDLSFLKKKLKDLDWDNLISDRFRIKER